MPENPYCFPRINLGRKTINESLFDITMGSYDGAEICELVGLYILSILGKVYGIQNVGLYWDGGLTCTRLMDQHRTKYRKISSGPSGRTLA